MTRRDILSNKQYHLVGVRASALYRVWQIGDATALICYTLTHVAGPKINWECQKRLKWHSFLHRDCLAQSISRPIITSSPNESFNTLGQFSNIKIGHSATTQIKNLL
jgi:hypothetical protein